MLFRSGVDDEIVRSRSGPTATLEAAIALRAALAQLMDPRRLGGFAVELFLAGDSARVEALADPRAPLPGVAPPNRPLV